MDTQQQALYSQAELLTARVKSLEARWARLTRALGATIISSVLTASFVAMRRPPVEDTPREIRASRVVLCDGEAVVAELTPNPGRGFAFSCPGSDTRIVGGMLGTGAALSLVRADGKEGLTLGTSEFGGQVSVHGTRGVICSIGSVKNLGAAGRVLVSAGENVMVMLASDPKLGGCCVTYDSHGQPTAVLPPAVARSPASTPGTQQPPPAPGAAPAPLVYLGVGSGHWISDASGDGKIITLEDDSVWEIDSIDRIYTTLWLRTTSITIKELGGGRYLLINTDDGETANAKLLAR